MQRRFDSQLTRKKSILFWCVYWAAVMLCCGFLVGALAGCKAKAPVPTPPPAANADHSITLNWQQSFANNPPCSTSLTTSCIVGFGAGYLDPAGKQQQFTTQTTAACTIANNVGTCTATVNATLPIGLVTFWIVTQYNDQNGAAGETKADLSAAVAVGADSATGYAVTINN